jgi:hypothetical protein
MYLVVVLRTMRKNAEHPPPPSERPSEKTDAK